MSGPTPHAWRHQWKARGPVPGQDKHSSLETCELCGAVSYWGADKYSSVGLVRLLCEPADPGTYCPESCEETVVLLVHAS